MSKPRRSFGAQAEAVEQLIKLIQSAKGLRQSEKDELKLRAELGAKTLWDLDAKARTEQFGQESEQ